MEDWLGIAARKTLTATERKVADAKAEREFDLAFLARQKKRKSADPAKNVSHGEMKKRLGL